MATIGPGQGWGGEGLQEGDLGQEGRQVQRASTEPPIGAHRELACLKELHAPAATHLMSATCQPAWLISTLPGRRTGLAGGLYCSGFTVCTTHVTESTTGCLRNVTWS